MGCNCKKNRTKVITPRMLMRKRELEAKANKEKEAQDGEKD